jgi:hypothetical protein
MKLVIITLVALLSIVSEKSQATEIKVSPVVIRSFNSEFVNASEVKWTVADLYYKAEFIFSGQYVTAYYDENGQLIAVARNISSHELPLSLQKNLNKFYTNYWITNLFELTDESGTNYYLTLENADTRMTLRSNASLGWNLFSKQNK